MEPILILLLIKWVRQEIKLKESLKCYLNSLIKLFNVFSHKNKKRFNDLFIDILIYLCFEFLIFFQSKFIILTIFILIIKPT